MKTKVSDVGQYNIVLEKDDIKWLLEKGAITIDSHRDISVPFIHIILDRENRKEKKNGDC